MNRWQLLTTNPLIKVYPILTKMSIIHLLLMSLLSKYVAKKSEPEKKSIVKAFKELVAHIVDTIKKALSRGNLTQEAK